MLFRSAAPADELARFESLWTDSSPTDVASPTHLRDACDRFAAWLRRAVERWTENRASRDDVQLVNWMLERGLLTNHVSQFSDDIRLELERYRAVERTIPEPQTANGMADVDSGWNYRLNVRGEYDDLADPVPRGYVKSIVEKMPSTAEETVSSPRSGRRELAQFVASSENPLTARVYVNRVWQWMYGNGLVQTADDFGHLGDVPIHQPLLDTLSVDFMTGGWSTKRLIRRMAQSSTWRQSGATSEQAMQVDPDNRLWHHFAMRRLEAESIRDAMMVAAGRIDHQLYGPPTNPPRTNEDSQKQIGRAHV